MVGILVTAVSGLASAMFSKSSISAEPGARSSSSFYDISLPDINNEQIQLDKFKGKKTTYCECRIPLRLHFSVQKATRAI